MSGKGTNWLKGCAIGCGSIVVLSIILSIGGSLALLQPFKGAINQRQKLDEKFGDQAQYRPPVDGVVANDRMDAFVAVRRDLMVHCPGFEETFQQFEHMGEVGNEENVPKGVMFREITRTVGKALGLAGKIGRFAIARNQALTDHEMGLGEYSYIYTTVYFGWLQKSDRIIESENDDIEINDDNMGSSTREALRSIMVNQLEDLQALSEGERGELKVEILMEELAALNEDHDRVPWQDGVPSHIAMALEPYREELEALWCEELAAFELAKHKRRGVFTISTD